MCASVPPHALPLGALRLKLTPQLHVLAYPSSLSGWREKDHFLAGAMWGATALAFLLTRH